MLIGVPRGIKTREYSVGLTPAAVRELVHHGHAVVGETGAGAAVDHDDDDYRAAGADIASDAKTVWERAELIVKVKEPQRGEFALLRPGQILFTYLHLAAEPEVTEALAAAGAIAIAYETEIGRAHV